MSSAAVQRRCLCGGDSHDLHNDKIQYRYGFVEEGTSFKIDPRMLDFVENRKRNRREKFGSNFRRARLMIGERENDLGECDWPGLFLYIFNFKNPKIPLVSYEPQSKPNDYHP